MPCHVPPVITPSEPQRGVARRYQPEAVSGPSPFGGRPLILHSLTTTEFLLCSSVAVVSTDGVMALVDGTIAVRVTESLPPEVRAFLISKRSPSTRESYERVAKRWLTWCTQTGIDWRTARQVHVDVWRESLTAERLSNATVANRLSGVSSLYAYLIRHGVVEVNPAAEVERPVVTTDESETPALDEKEAAALMGVAVGESLRTRVAIGVLLTTGLRISELVAAEDSSIQMTRGQRVIRVTRKGGRVARIALPAQVAHDVDLMIGARGDGPLIRTSTGKGCDRQYLHGLVRRLALAAGIPPETAAKCGPHALRRTAATLLLDAEAPLDDVRDLLGHADARTTQGYSRSRKRLQKQARHVTSLAELIYPEDDPFDGE